MINYNIKKNRFNIVTDIINGVKIMFWKISCIFSINTESGIIFLLNSHKKYFTIFIIIGQINTFLINKLITLLIATDWS